MPEQNPIEEANNVVTPSESYEAPAIETVISPDDVEREAHYAGNVFSGLR